MTDERIEQRVGAWARSHPEAKVVTSAAGELDFGLLDRLSLTLAHHLRSLGIGRGDFVLVHLERDPGFLVAILGVLRAGGAFIPSEPGGPPRRLQRIAQRPEVAAVLTSAALVEVFVAVARPLVVFDLAGLAAVAPTATPLPPAGDADDPAYGISTSGSSGEPKTVVVTHRPLVQLVDWLGHRFGLGPGDRGLWVSPATFDLSIFDLLGLPALGATVHVVSGEDRTDPSATADHLIDSGITFWNSAPALLQTLVPFLAARRGAAAGAPLRLAFLSGDWVPLGLPDVLRRTFPTVDVIALGGATEATVWSNYFPIGAIDPAWPSIPYGRPIPNARYHLLDEALEPVAVGARGELYIAGEGLALGYLGNPRATAERFLPDPFGPGRMYRTGDGARAWPDGTLELLGRLDHQVNVSGYRVDLGEVESALLQAGFTQAVAVPVATIAGTLRLAAVGVPREPTVDLATVRRTLAATLPGYMVPDPLRIVDALPLTAHGKVDRRALAELFSVTPRPALTPSPPVPPTTLADDDGAARFVDFLTREVTALTGLDGAGLDPERPLGEAGLGSLEFAHLAGRLFEAFALRIHPVEFYAASTLTALAASLAARAAPAAPPGKQASPPAAPAAVAAAPAIVGLALRVPGADDPEALWRHLLAGRDLLRPRPGGGERAGWLDDVDAFDAAFFAITPREAEALDPRQRLLLETVWTAIAESGDDPARLAGSRTGVFVGATGDDFSRLSQPVPEAVGAHTLTGIAPAMLANRISYQLDLQGPSEVVDTACSSSLVALHRAVSALAADECDAAVVAGVSLMLDATTQQALTRLGMLSPTGACRSFDADADGYARGEGVVVVYLKREAADHRVWARVLGSAVGHGGRGVSLTAPTPRGERQVIVAAHRRAGIDPRTVGLIATHGTGTSLGDPIETRALVEAFSELYADHGLAASATPHCALASIKTNLGHLEAAAGLVGVVQAILAAQRGQVPPLVHFRRRNPQIELAGSPFFLTSEASPWPVAGDGPRRVGVSAFGFGGSNAHVVLECPVAAERSGPPLPAFRRRSFGPAFLSRSTAANTGEAELALAPFAGLFTAHHIDGRPLLPAAVSILLLAGVARDLLGSGAVGLSRVHFLGNLGDGPPPSTLSARWRREGELCHLELRADATLLCRADARMSPPDLGPPAAGTKATSEYPGAAVYELFAAHGLRLADPLRTIRRAAFGPLSATAELTAEEPAALLDGAFQTALFWQLASAPAAGLPVPFALASLVLAPTLAAATAVVVTEAAGPRTAIRTTDFTLADAAGRVVARASGFAALGHRAAVAGSLRLFAHDRGRQPPRRRATPATSLWTVGPETLGADRHFPSPEALAGHLADGGERPDTVAVVVTGRDVGALCQLAATLARDLARHESLARPLRLLFLPTAADATAGRALGAFCRTLRHEHPGILATSLGFPRHPTRVDLELLRTIDWPAEAELVGGTGELRVPTLSPLVPAGTDGELTRGAVVLLTGGLGGVGRLIAAHLLAHYQVRLMLVGRSPLEGERARCLDQLRMLPGEVAYQRADVTRHDEVQQLLAATRRRFGPIGVVVHAAGVLDDRLLAYAEPAAGRAVVAPKLTAAEWLDLETATDPLALFVLFSSLVATTGNPGQATYAFANGGLEGFAVEREARRRAGRCHGRTVTIGWGPWRSAGMALPPGLEPRLAKRHGLGVLAAESAGAVFEAALAAGRQAAAPSLLALATTRPDRLAAWLAGTPEAAVPSSPAIVTEGIPMHEDRPTAKLLTLVVEAIAAESKLRPEEIDPETRFEDYGIDSVLVLAITERLEESLGPLPKTLFFEHHTARALATHLTTMLAPPVARSPKADSGARERAPSHLEAAPADAPIAIVGMAGRFPGADDLEAFWARLAAGYDAITEVPADRWDPRLVVPPDDALVGTDSGFRWGGFLDDVYGFDPGFFRLSQREAEMTDPQERLFLMAAYHCLEDAGYPGRRLAGDPVGVFVGVMWGQYEMWGLERADAASSYGSVAHRVSHHFDFRGPSLALDTMCSSSLTALHLAAASLRAGESSLVLAGGVNVNAHPNKHLFLCRRHFAAPDGRCRSFGAGGSGYVAGEGVGVVAMKTLAAARRDGDRILGLLRGSAVNHDGRTHGYTVPNPQAQTAVIRGALERAGVAPETLGYVEAHGTGTALGDPLEVSALAAALGARPAEAPPCAVGSVKSNIGHAESAAGIAGVLKVLLQLRERRLVPSLHADPPNPDIPFDTVPLVVQRQLAPWPAPVGAPRRAGVSSFGAGGANAHLILEEWLDSAPPAGPEEQLHLIPLSAKNSEQLAAVTQRLADWLAAAAAAAAPKIAPDSAPASRPDVATLTRRVLDHTAAVLGLERRYLREDDHFEDYELSAEARAELARRLAAACDLPADGVAWDDTESPADLARRLASHQPTGEAPGCRLADLAFTLQTGREALPFRRALLVGSNEELLVLLRALDAGAHDDPRVHHGVVDRRVPGSEAERAFLANLVAKHRLDRLARLWCDGAEVDWQGLHPPGSRRRLTLPGYPFARRVCRVPMPTPLVHGRAGALSPWLDGVDPGASLTAGLVFRKTLSARVPLGRARTPDGAPAVGVGLALAAALAARQAAGLAATHALCELGWQAPHLLPELAELTVRLTPLEPAVDAGELALEVALAGAPVHEVLRARLRPGAALEDPASALLEHGDCDLEDWEPDAWGEAGLLPDLCDLVLAKAGAGGAGRAAAFFATGTVPRSGTVVAGSGSWRLRDEEGRDVLGFHGLEGSPPATRPSVTTPVETPAHRSAVTGLHEVVWLDTGASGDDPEVDPRRERLVIFSPSERRLRDALVRLLGAVPLTEILVAGAADLEGIVDAVTALPAEAEVFLLVAGARMSAGPAELEAALLRGLAPLLALARGLERRARERRGEAGRLTIGLFTFGAHRLDDEALQPLAAVAAALAPVLAREASAARVTAVDLIASRHHDRLDQGVRRALALARRPPIAGGVFAVRDGRVRRRALRPLPLPRVAQASPERPVIVLVGGAGVVGRQLSAELARRHHARLTWLGRRRPNPEITAEIERLAEAGGSRLRYLAADVTDANELTAALTEVVRLDGPIDTVYHCAMEFAVTRLASLDEAALAGALRAKTRGSLELLAAAADLPIRRVVLMSSAEALVGNAGWGAYGAGCAFQDALALGAPAAGSPSVLAVDWGYWQGSERGAAATLEAKGVRPLSAASALDALEALFATPHARVAVLDVEPEVIARMGLLDDSAAAFAAAAQPLPVGATPTLAPAPQLTDAATEVRLRQLLGRTLRIDPAEIDANADMAEYGVDSILVLDFVALIEQAFGRLRVEDLIEHQTIAALAAEIDRQRPTAAPPAPSSTIVVDAAPPEEVGRFLRSYPPRFDLPEAELVAHAATAGSPGAGVCFRLLGANPAEAIEVVSGGQGPPILLLPAIGLTAPVFHHQYQALAPEWTLHTVHAPGQGRSRPPRQATLEALAETVAATSAELAGDRPVHVVASCLGTVVALYLAAHYPERVRSLTLCGAFSEDAELSPIPAEGLSAKELADLTAAAAQSLADDFAPVGAAAPSGRRAAIREARDLLLASQKASPAVGLRYLNDVLKLRPSQWATKITAPTLFVVGELDSVVDPSSTLKSVQLIRDAQILRLPTAGHYPFLTHPEDFNPRLVEFLRSVEYAPV